MYFLAAHGFLVIISIAAWICVLAFGGLAHKTLIRIMTTGFSPGGATEMLADLAIVGASKFPSALSVLLVSVFRRLFYYNLFDCKLLDIKTQGHFLQKKTSTNRQIFQDWNVKYTHYDI